MHCLLSELIKCNIKHSNDHDQCAIVNKHTRGRKGCFANPPKCEQQRWNAPRDKELWKKNQEPTKQIFTKMVCIIFALVYRRAKLNPHLVNSWSCEHNFQWNEALLIKPVTSFHLFINKEKILWAYLDIPRTTWPWACKTSHTDLATVNSSLCPG